MSGFDNAKVDAAFFAGTRIRSNFLVNLGHRRPRQHLPALAAAGLRRSLPHRMTSTHACAPTFLDIPPRRSSMLRTASLVAACCSPSASPTPRRSGTRSIPNHTQVDFSWNHFGFSNIRSAASTRSTGNFQFDPADPTRSVDRRHHADRGHRHRRRRKLDEHLQSPDFFDAAQVSRPPPSRARKVERVGERQAEGHRRPHHPRRHQAGGARRDHQQDRRAPDGRPRRGRLRRQRPRSSAATSASASTCRTSATRSRSAHHHRGDGAAKRRCGGATKSDSVIIERPSAARGAVHAGWLDSRHTFSFGHYHDPQWMGFGPLRVINEDRVAPGARLPAAPPRQHGNPQLRAVRRARAQGQQRRRAACCVPANCSG